MNEALRKSGAFDAIIELVKRTKFLGELTGPNEALTESMDKLGRIEAELQGPHRLMEDTKAVEELIGPPLGNVRVLPPSPTSMAHETNRQLGDLNSEVEGLRSTQTEMIGVLQTVVNVQMRTDRKTGWIVVLTAIGIAVAILLGVRVL